MSFLSFFHRQAGVRLSVFWVGIQYHMMKAGVDIWEREALVFSLIIDKISTDWETYPVTETLFDKNRRQNYENFIF